MPSAPHGGHVEGEMIGRDFYKKSVKKKMNVTSLKTLIAHEISKKVESRHPPNVIAKLMGLDTLPFQLPNTPTERNLSKHSSRSSSSLPEKQVDCWARDRRFLNKKMHHKAHKHEEQSAYEGVRDLKTRSRNFPQPRGRYSENANADEEKMALVRHKFMEAKYLATNKMGRQSKEFQDALEVLSSNRDLFLKFLQEPNSLSSQHPHDTRSVPQPPKTKRITVLKPSKRVDEKFATLAKNSDKQKEAALMGQPTGWVHQCSPSFADRQVNECPAQSTHIVVLKPSPTKALSTRSLVSPLPISSRILCNGGDFYGELHKDSSWESSEVAEEITRRMREHLMSHRSEETIRSSVFSNGYLDDDISSKKLDNEHGFEILSDSEIMSPNFVNSWDQINRFGSPYCSSSLTHVSCSPESSICREAKKQLSERWMMATSSSIYQDQTDYSRSSDNLVEIVTLSDTKKPMKFDDEALDREQESMGVTICRTRDLLTDKDMNDSPKSLLRSKSLPVMSAVYGTGHHASVSEVPKEPTRENNSKSSFREKVSSLFFLLNKKSDKEHVGASQSKHESQSAQAETSLSVRSDLECSVPSHGSSSKTTFKLLGSRSKQHIICREGGLTVTNPKSHGNFNENQDQPSPISVLEDPFKEDENTVSKPSSSMRVDCSGSNGLLNCNLIDKSPPIGSLARTISREDSFAKAASAYPQKASWVSSSTENGKDEWVSSVEALLWQAGLEGMVKSELPLVRWHSLESPLDPTLRDNNLYGKDLQQDAKRRKTRSHQKLVFDCVNEALLEIIDAPTLQFRQKIEMSDNKVVETASSTLLDLVLARTEDQFPREVRSSFEDGEDMTSWDVEMVVRKEVAGNRWINTRSEYDYLGMEIEGKLMEDLVEEAVLHIALMV